MATKNFMTLANLTSYDTLIKEYIGTEDAKSIKSITVSGNTVSFFKTADASGTASYTVNLPDVSGFMDKIASATGGKIVTSTSTGQVAESSTAISDLATNAFVGTIPSGATAITIRGYAKEVADSKDSAITAAQNAANTAQGEVDALEILVGTIPSGSEATTVVGYAAEVAGDSEDAAKGYADDLIAALDTSADVTIASKSGDVVTLKAGVKEVDGIIAQGTGSDITLAAVSSTGEAEDVSYDNTDSGLTATDVQGAIDEVVGGLGTAAAADVATSAIQEESTDDSLVSAAQVASFVATEIAGLEGAMHFAGVITRQTGETDAQAIARVITNPESGDVVVMSDNGKEYIYDGTAWREVGDETEFVKKTTTIAGVDLQDSITKTELLSALNVADGAQVNTIESVKVNGSALTPDGNKAVNVTVAEGATNGTVAVNGSDVAVHGLGSAAYTASTEYDAAGSASAAQTAAEGYADGLIAGLDANLSQTAGADGLALSITEVDGVITAISGSIASGVYDAAGAAATAETNANTYTDNATAAIATADIEALFS